MRASKAEVLKYACIMQIIYLVNIILSTYEYKEWEIEVSRVDCLMMNSSTWVTGMLIIPLVALYMLREYQYTDFPIYVIKNVSRRQIYVKQVTSLVIASLVVSVYQYVSSIMWSFLICDRFINWTDSNSVIYKLYKNTSDISFEFFSILYIIMLALCAFIGLLITNVCSWIAWKWTGIVIVILMCGIDIVQNKIFMLCEGILPQYKFVDSIKAVAIQLTAGVIVSVIIFVIGLRISDRREYMSEVRH